MEVANGALRRTWENADVTKKMTQILLPQNRVKSILRAVRSGSGRGHFEVSLTLEKMKERFYWVGCRATYGLKTRTRGRVHRCNVKAPFESIAIDLPSAFSETDSGNHYILVAVGDLSKWPAAYPLPNQNHYSGSPEEQLCESVPYFPVFGPGSPHRVSNKDNTSTTSV